MFLQNASHIMSIAIGLFMVFHGIFIHVNAIDFFTSCTGVSNDVNDSCTLSAITAYRDTRSLMLLITPVSGPNFCHEPPCFSNMKNISNTSAASGAFFPHHVWTVFVLMSEWGRCREELSIIDSLKPVSNNVLMAQKVWECSGRPVDSVCFQIVWEILLQITTRVLQ